MQGPRLFSNALVFWWCASTIRHLGVGGKSTDSAVWAAHKNAMQTYLPLKRFYTQGAFYGLDETVYAHTLPDLLESTVNCFNLDAKPVEKQIRFRLADIGLPAGKIDVEGAPFAVYGDEITLTVLVPAKGHVLVRLRLQRKQQVSADGDDASASSRGPWRRRRRPLPNSQGRAH